MGTGLAFFLTWYYVINMSRPARCEYPGGVYYIKAQGRYTKEIFRDDLDRVKFLDILSEAVFRFKWLCHSYCLLDNHYHLILETPYGNLSRGMRQVNGLYTQAFNRKYNRHGALFSGRFKSIIFEKARYLLPLNRHMIRNPMRAGLARDIESWQWSSYLPTVQKVRPPGFLFTQWILSRFSKKDRSLAIERYKHFISGKDEERFLWRDLRFQVFLGSDFFIEKIRKIILMHKMAKCDKTLTMGGETSAPLDNVIGRERISKRERDLRIYDAYVNKGYTLSEIAAYLGVHCSTVSRAIKRVERKLLR